MLTQSDLYLLLKEVKQRLAQTDDLPDYSKGYLEGQRDLLQRLTD